MEKTIKLILCTPNAEPKVVELPKKHHYTQLKKLLEIDSPIDCATRKLSNGKWYDLWIDDEGLLKAKARICGSCNNATEYLCGNILIARHDRYGNTTGLTDDEIDYILKNDFTSNEEGLARYGDRILDALTDEDGFIESSNGLYIARHGKMLRYSI